MRLADNKVVVIGASTGGPKAVEFILGKIRRNFPVGIIVVQHMPRFFTRFFAERLNRVCHLSVAEAQDGEIVEGGKVLVAPGDYNITIKKSLLAPQIELQQMDREQTKPTPFYRHAFLFGGGDLSAKRRSGLFSRGWARTVREVSRRSRSWEARPLPRTRRHPSSIGMPKSAIADGVVDKVLSLSNRSRR